MASADSGELLTYADTADLFALIDDQWDLFKPLLPPQRTCRASASSSKSSATATRTAVARTPTTSRGSSRRCATSSPEPNASNSSYLDTTPLQKSRDPIARAWIDRRHETAARLDGHAERKHHVHLRLSHSTRRASSGTPHGSSATATPSTPPSSGAKSPGNPHTAT